MILEGEHVRTVFKVPEPTLCTQDEDAPRDDVGDYGSGAQPPYHRVSEKVDLPVVLDPEVLQMR